LLKLRWWQVDFKAKRIRLEPGTTKNKKGRTLSIYGEMVERERWWKGCGWRKKSAIRAFAACQHVFHRVRKPIKNFRKFWDAACSAAGLDGLMFHDLCRTAVRNMVRAGIPEKTAMAISGTRRAPSLIAITS
jgi:integrase